jgi:hypothetical protein
MDHVTAAIRNFSWFLIQTAEVGGLGFTYFLIPLAILATIMVATFPRRAQTGGRGIAALGWVPAIWIFVGLWGGWFWYDWQNHATRNPSWVSYPVDGALPVLLILNFHLIRRLNGARVFVAAFMLVNIYFTLSMSFLAGMAITGEWL